MKEISGHTRLFGILADPIHHVKTPQRMNEHFARLGFDGVCVPFHARPAELAQVVQGLRQLQNLGGFIVTMPHKTAILDLVDEATPVARKIGAANVVRRDADGRLTAHMLDGEGFVGGLIEAGVDPKGKSAYLAGAGGGQRHRLRAGAGRRGAADHRQPHDGQGRGPEGAHPVAASRCAHRHRQGGSVRPRSGRQRHLAGHARHGSAAVDAGRLTPDQLVCEVIMQPRDTALLQAAAARGCRVHHGAPMLACQIALMAEMMGVRA